MRHRGRAVGARGLGVTLSAVLAATLLPAEAWAIAPPAPRVGPSLVGLQQEEPADPDQAKIDELSTWSGAPVEPPVDYTPTATTPPAGGTAPVALDGAGDDLVPVGNLPVRLGKASPTDEEPDPPAPGGTWDVAVEPRTSTEASDVDGALITVTPPSGGATPVDIELDYGKFEDLFGTAWSSRLRLTQLPECFLTTPELDECTTVVDVPSVNDPSNDTVRATIDPAASPQQGLSTQSGGGPVVLAATDSASGAGGTYKATPFTATGTWTAGGSGGGFSWSYPLTAPAPPAGPAPTISLSYSSQSVDGRTSAANGQASWIGDGWDYNPGFIERRYRSCNDDRSGTPNNAGGKDKKKSDLCWASDNLVMSLGGSATALVHDGTTGAWVAQNDTGARIEYRTRTGSPKTAQTGAYDGEYWVVTTRDGTRYWFGRNTIPGRTAATDSALTVPVFGNHSGEPCHATAYADSSCAQAWRWNLDYVEDVHGNAMIVDWKKETNRYARNEKFKEAVAYHRGGYPAQILYGLRADDLNGVPAGKVVFKTAPRCVEDAGTTCSPTGYESENYADKQPWWDTPATLHCKAGAKNCFVTSPTFWSSVRLTEIETHGRRTPGSTALSLVDSWTLKQSFPKQRTDTHPPLWLESITRTGHGAPNASGEQTSRALPPVSFLPNVVDMPNRVSKGAADETPDFDRLRVETVRTETGGEIHVDYSAPCAVGTAHPSPETNTTRCFPVHYSPDPEALSDEILAKKPAPVEWFNKYVVQKVTEKDRVARQPDVVTTYAYEGGGAWGRSTDEFTKPKLRTYDQWRGYASVLVRKGVTGADPAAADATEQSQTRMRYFRGMSGDAGRPTVTVKDSTGAETLGEDLAPYQGMPAETVAYTRAGGDVASRILAWPTSRETASQARPGLPALKAHRVATARTETVETISGGRTRTARTVTTYDDTYGLPLTAETLTLTPDGSGGTTTGDRSCSTNTYVHNTAKHLIGLVQRARTTVGTCAQAATAPGSDVVSDTRVSYDALDAFGAAPVRGLPFRTDTVGADGTGWVTSARTEYDPLGRATEVRDAKGHVSKVGFVPPTGPAFTTTSTDAKGHTTTTALDPARGTALSVTDANGRRTTSTYDELGRTTAVWSPSRTQGTDKASVLFDYQIEDNKVPATRTRVLRDNGTYEDSVTVYDGLLRPRQAQTEALGGGRIVTETLYNANGAPAETRNGYLAEGEPQTELFVPLSLTQVPSASKTAYDGLGRAVRTTVLHAGDPQHSATVRHEGDRTLTRTGMSADGTTPMPGSRSTATWTDALGRTSKIEHFTATDLSAAIETRYTHDARGNLAKVTDARDNIWTYTYDARGRLAFSTDPDAGSSSFGYDVLDRQIWSKDSRQRSQHTVYDELGRRTELRDDSAEGPLVAKWTYDTLPGAKGLPVASTRYHEGAEFTSEVTGYDQEYRPTGSRTTIPSTPLTTGLAGTYTYKNTYTPTGLPQSVELPATPGGLAAEKVITRYDGEGSPRTTSGLAWYTADTVLSPLGQVLRTASGEAPNRVWATHFYDENTGRLDRRITDRETLDPSRISETSYAHDTVGNITSITDTQSPARVDRQCFAYDPMGRLAHAWTAKSPGCPRSSTAQGAGPNRTDVSPSIDGAGYWHSYEFDTIGNRTGMVVHDPADPALDDTYVYTHGVPSEGPLQPATLQPHTLTKVDATVRGPGSTVTSSSTYAYDPSGNTTQRVIGGDTQALTWDRRNKLMSADTDDDGTADVTYLYDASGNRLLEADATTRTLYLGESEIVVDTAGRPVEARRYYSHPGAPTTLRTTGGRTSGHTLTVQLTDHHNTPTASVALTGGQPVTRRMFDPYGNPRGTEPTTWPDRRTYLGVGIDDETTGLTHIGAREYDPTTGRFISADPIIDIADPLQMNGYAYANNNPITNWDPTGLKSDECGSLYRCGGNQVITTKTTEYQDVNTVARHFEKTASWATLAQWKAEGLGNSPAFGKAKKLTKWKNEHYEKNWGINLVAGMARSWVSGVDAAASAIMPFPTVQAAPLYDSLVSSLGVNTKGRAYANGEGLMDGLSMVGGVGAIAAGIKGGLKMAAKGCRPGNSFAPGTEVALADGTTKPIEDVEIGDEVLATDPKTGETRAEKVTAEIRGDGTKNLVKVTIDTDGDRGTDTAEITATDGHPFWVPELGRWIDATDLAPGQWLRTSAGTHVQITAIKRWTETATVHNLTVADLHTYYVLAGATPVLVHNCNVALGQKAEGTYSWADGKGFKHFGGYAPDAWQGPVENAIRDSSVTLHVNLRGLGNFTESAKAGLQPGAYATDMEMGWIARAVGNGERSWSSINFYRPNAKGALERVDVAEPDWASFGRLRPFISDAGKFCGC
ncbi:polymorphic toxin-type HINT domain-containing protein [Streptomyces bacillaris]|uniref:polymorphic toxin-type HINT domain-containing protein n=1 Tax=Streptomyces bacillaris TaxID=68179 RepID=UPI0034613AC1